MATQSQETSSAHTLGPWHAIRALGTELRVTARNSHVAILLPHTDSRYDDDLQEANARLIAAAADLLAACQKMAYALAERGDLDTMNAASVAIYDAIKKATKM